MLTAHHEFKLVATMNPAGDFGKKELSPALRNRFTEIWVDSVFDKINLVENKHENIVEFLTKLT